MEKQLFQEIINDLKNDDDDVIVASTLVELYRDNSVVDNMIQVLIRIDDNKVDKVNFLRDLVNQYQILLKYIKLTIDKQSNTT